MQQDRTPALMEDAYPAAVCRLAREPEHAILLALRTHGVIDYRTAMLRVFLFNVESFEIACHKTKQVVREVLENMEDLGLVVLEIEPWFDDEGQPYNRIVSIREAWKRLTVRNCFDRNKNSRRKDSEAVETIYEA